MGLSILCSFQTYSRLNKDLGHFHQSEEGAEERFSGLKISWYRLLSGRGASSGRAGG